MVDNQLRRRTLLRGIGAATAVFGGGAALTGTARAATVAVPGDQPTIQDAVDAASAGDTVQVDAGSYGESVVVDKPLTIRGDPGGPATAGVGPDAPRTSVFEIEPSASGTTITGFILNGSESIYVDVPGEETLSDLTVTSNQMESAEIELNASGVGAEFSNIDFSWNSIRNEDLEADWTESELTVSGFSVVNNVFDGSSGDALDIDIDGVTDVDIELVINCNEINNADSDGIEFELDADSSNTYDITVFNNSIGGADNEGIEFLDNGGDELSASITYNDITGCSTGIRVDGDGDPTGITIENNNISNNTDDGVDHGDSEGAVLDARNNYWGASDGPSGGVADPESGAQADGSGDSIVDDGPVRFDPFLDSAVSRPEGCTEGAPPPEEEQEDTEPPDDNEAEFSLVCDRSGCPEDALDGHERVELSEESPDPGEEIELSVTVTNVGDDSGTYFGELSDGFRFYGAQRVELDEGEKTTLTYSVTFEDAGTYRMFLSGDHIIDITVGDVPGA
jgi:hypothetical protein